MRLLDTTAAPKPHQRYRSCDGVEREAKKKESMMSEIVEIKCQPTIIADCTEKDRDVSESLLL
jgi:hypothetical protein